MKKYVLPVSIALVTMVAILGFAANSPTSVFANELSNDLVDENLVFDRTHRNVTTKHGNVVTTAVQDRVVYDTTYLCKLENASSDGYFYTTTPIQSISKVSITWSAGSAYELYFWVGSSKGKSDAYNSGNLVSLLKNYPEKTTTINVPNPENAHYFTIYCKKFDTGTYYRFRSVTITYSCSYSL